MNEQELDRLLSLEEKEQSDICVHNGENDSIEEDRKSEKEQEEKDISLVKKLKKAVDRQINKRVFGGIILAVIGTVLCLLLVSVSLDFLFYDPTEPSRYIDDSNHESDYVYSDFHFLMDIYTGLHYPGKRYYQLEEKSTGQGFGSYKMYAKIQDVYKELFIDGTYNTVYEIKRNRFFVEALEADSRQTILLWDFYNDSKADADRAYLADIYDMDEERMSEIEKLPESAVIYATVSFKEALTLEDTLDFIRRYPDSDFCWIGMDSEVQFMVGSFDGIRLSGVIGYPLTDEAKEQYPNLLLSYIAEETTAEDLKECYLSRLRILKENPEFLRVVSYEHGYYGDARRKMEQIQDRLDEIEEKGLWSIGLYGEITKEDFKTMVERGEITYANIKDAKVSVFSK